MTAPASAHKAVYGNKTWSGVGILSYPSVFKAMPNQYKDNKLFFQCNVLIPKSETPMGLISEMQKVALKAFGPNFKTLTSHPNSAIKDGDKMTDKDGNLKTNHPEAGHWVISASSKEDRPPDVVDGRGRTVTDTREIYGGAIGQILVKPASYKISPRQFGITLYLLAVMKVADGEAFGGSSSFTPSDLPANVEVPAYLRSRVTESVNRNVAPLSGVPSWSPSASNDAAMAAHFGASQVAEDDIPF